MESVHQHASYYMCSYRAASRACCEISLNVPGPTSMCVELASSDKGAAKKSGGEERRRGGEDKEERWERGGEG